MIEKGAEKLADKLGIETYSDSLGGRRNLMMSGRRQRRLEKFKVSLRSKDVPPVFTHVSA